MKVELIIPIEGQKNASFRYLYTCPKSSNFAASNDAAYFIPDNLTL